MRFKRTLPFLMSALFALAAPALAQQPAQPEAKPVPAPAQQPAQPEAKPEASAPKQAKATAGGERLCAEDAMKFCTGVQAGGGRLYQCLAKNNAELSAPCRERLTAGKARWDAFVSACKSDADKHCQGITTGSGRVLSCLKKHEAELAPDCKARFTRANSDPVVTR